MEGIPEEDLIAHEGGLTEPESKKQKSEEPPADQPTWVPPTNIPPYAPYPPGAIRFEFFFFFLSFFFFIFFSSFL